MPRISISKHVLMQVSSGFENKLQLYLQAEAAIEQGSIADIGRAHSKHDSVADEEADIEASGSNGYDAALHALVCQIGVREAGGQLPDTPGPFTEREDIPRWPAAPERALR